MSNKNAKNYTGSSSKESNEQQLYVNKTDNKAQNKADNKNGKDSATNKNSQNCK